MRQLSLLNFKNYVLLLVFYHAAAILPFLLPKFELPQDLLSLNLTNHLYNENPKAEDNLPKQINKEDQF